MMFRNEILIDDVICARMTKFRCVFLFFFTLLNFCRHSQLPVPSVFFLQRVNIKYVVQLDKLMGCCSQFEHHKSPLHIANLVFIYSLVILCLRLASYFYLQTSEIKRLSANYTFFFFFLQRTR